MKMMMMKNKLLLISVILVILLIGVIVFELFLLNRTTSISPIDLITGKVHKTDLDSKVRVEEGQEAAVGEGYLVFSGLLVERAEDRLRVKSMKGKPPLNPAKEIAFIVDANTSFYEAVVEKGKEPLFVERKFSDLEEGVKVFVRYNESQKNEKNELVASRIGFQRNSGEK